MNPSPPMRIDIAHLLRIAIPISLGSLVQFLVVLTDNFFLSRAGEVALNGAGNAGLVYLTFSMILAGGSVGVQILVARFQGEGNLGRMADAARTGRLALTATGVFLTAFVLGINAVEGWSLLLERPEVRDIFTPFLGIRGWGFVPYALLMAVEGDWIGQAKTRPVLLIALVMAGTNMLLDAMWVEGMWGATALGADGAAWASLAAESLGAVLAWALSRQRVHPAAFQGRASLSRPMLAQWWKLSSPVMGQFGLTIATWTSFFFFVERVGMMELKVSHLTRNAFMLAFVVCSGLGQTTRTVVSTLIGEGRQRDLPKAIGRLVLLSYAGVWALTHGYIAYPQWIAGHFFEATDVEGIQAMSATLGTAFVALQGYALSSILISILQGAGFTRRVFAIELSTVTLYMVAAYFLAIHWPQPIAVIWRADWVYFGGMLLGSWWVLQRVDWKRGHASLEETPSS